MSRIDRLRRLRAELWLLEEAPDGLTARELATELDVSTRTAQRDLLALRATGYPLSSVGSRWRFVEGQALPTSLAADGASQAPERDRVMLLDRAIRQRRPLEVEYLSLAPDPEGALLLRLAPLVLRYHEGSLFLVARELPTGRLRTLVVERLVKLRSDSGRFPPRARQGLERYLEEKLRDAASSELIRVAVSFEAASSWRVLERTWHPSQRVTLGDDGSAVVTFRVPGFAWIKAWALGFGAEAVILEPPALIRIMADELERACHRYLKLRQHLTQLDLFARHS